MSAKDPFAGIWNLNPGRSHFRSGHRPTGGTMFWERTPEGYLMRAEGTTCDGKAVQEGLQAFNLDEKEHPVPGAPGLVAIAHHPDANTIHVQAKNSDQVVGEGSYKIEPLACPTVSIRDDQANWFSGTEVSANGRSHVWEKPSVFTEPSHDCRSVKGHYTRFQTSEVGYGRVGVA